MLVDLLEVAWFERGLQEMVETARILRVSPLHHLDDATTPAGRLRDPDLLEVWLRLSRARGTHASLDVEKEVAGCGFGQVKENFHWAVNKHYGYIGLMYVDERFRGNRIGGMIIEALADWFKGIGISDIRVQVYDENVNAVEAYRKYGFKDYFKTMQYDVD